MTDIVIRVVEGYGYLPIVSIDGKEIYRGEFTNNPQEALNRCINFLDKL